MNPEARRQTFTVTLDVHKAMSMLGFGEQWRAVNEGMKADPQRFVPVAMQMLRTFDAIYGPKPSPETRRLLAELYPMEE